MTVALPPLIKPDERFSRIRLSESRSFGSVSQDAVRRRACFTCRYSANGSSRSRSGVNILSIAQAITISFTPPERVGTSALPSLPAGYAVPRIITVGSEEAHRQRCWPPSATQTGCAVFPRPAFTRVVHLLRIPSEGISAIRLTRTGFKTLL